ncbi:hypothetical protein HY772_10195 [Candidatus Woesearchaeota archaeon]|nr:hypothetical protein [Candidatus Woesearchaeota archaeon]
MSKPFVERTLETLVDFADIHRQALSQTNENINALTAQIGVLSESVTRLEIQVERIANTTEAQTDTVNRLTRLVEQLVSRN